MAAPATRAIRVPERIVERINQLVRTSRRILLESGREPSPDELAASLGMSPEKVHKLLEIARAPIRPTAPLDEGPVSDRG